MLKIQVACNKKSDPKLKSQKGYQGGMGLRGVLGTLTLPSVNFIPKETEYEDRINVKKISFHPAIKISLVVGGGGGWWGVVGFCG